MYLKMRFGRFAGTYGRLYRKKQNRQLKQARTHQNRIADNVFPPGTNPLSNKIYTACFGNTDEVLGGKFVADRAKKKIDDHTKYNVLFNNCHRFSAGCITGNFDNEVMSFAQLEETILLHIEQLRAPLPFWQRVKNWFVKEKKTVKPSSFNWRAVKFD